MRCLLFCFPTYTSEIPMKWFGVIILMIGAGAYAQEKDSRWALPGRFSFCGETVPTEQQDVRERLDEIFFSRTGNDERIVLLMKRTRKYFPVFERILKEMDAPDDLKYLAAAESGLRLEAYSSAEAGGLWQFIPSTARLWGLTVTKHVDERFHVEKSTRASIAMMKHLHEAYGSWCLAAAAYNTGQANLNRVLREQDQETYFDLFLNRETRFYVFHIAVLKEIMEHPERYGVVLRDEDYYEPYDEATQQVTITGPVADVGRWAKSAGTNYKTVKLLNYWIMKNSLPAGPWNILLPASITLDSSLLRPFDVSSAMTVPDSSLQYVFHTVRKGDYLEKIADRYGVTVHQIQRWNGLTSSTAVLGTRLKIFVPETYRTLYKVRNGDTLMKIATTFNVSVKQIKAWNGLEDEMVKPGEELILYLGANE